MGALYHLKQKLVDFCNVIQENVSRTDTVPSSKVVYDLKADSDSQISDLEDSLNNKVIFADASITLTSSSNVRTIELSTNRAGYTTVAASFVQNDGIYFLSATDGIYPALSITNNGNVQLFGMNKALATSADRIIKVRCAYIAN